MWFMYAIFTTVLPNSSPQTRLTATTVSPITFLHLRMFPMARDHASNKGPSPTIPGIHLR